MTMHPVHARVAYTGLLCAVAALLVGCPVPTRNGPIQSQAKYDDGFLDGFASDTDFDDGYYDGWSTEFASPYYYDVSDIPNINALTYEAGYWDGVFLAYNDGYFQDYRYAFVVGFSEGYDNAFWPDYLIFLANDMHLEFLNGGWGDGYNDGFSEGRIFGATDYEGNYDFDWLAALLRYENGSDLYFEELNLGSGDFGPVVQYEHGTDPALNSKQTERRARVNLYRATVIRAWREADKINTNNLDPVRPLTLEQEADLDRVTLFSLRSDRSLLLTSSWLERIHAYMDSPPLKLNRAERSRSR